ncbi:Arm DNA-binding domain-containing protein [Pontibacter qinzhouensis]
MDTRKPNKNGTYPIRVRVTHKRVQKYYSTDTALTVPDWERL